jgi:hypothetical protein
VAEHELTAEKLAEELRKLRVSDLIVSTCATLAQLGFAKLDPESRDLEQARLAVDALRALVPVLERAGDEAVARDFRQVVANLQLAYAGAATAPAAESEPSPADGEPAPDREGL